MQDVEKYAPPTETLGDQVHAVARAALGAIPYAGNAACELLQKIVAPPIKIRINDWMENIADGLKRLENEQRCKIEDLGKNDAFTDTIMYATQAAVRTSKDGKRKALQNAVLNSALPNPPDETSRQMFLSLVDTFSELHLRFLAIFQDPPSWLAANNKPIPTRESRTLWELVSYIFPELKDQRAIAEQVCKELHNRGLLIAASLNEEVSRYPYFPTKPIEQQPGYYFAETPGIGNVVYSGSHSALRPWTTELGNQFLAFISSPTEQQPVTLASRAGCHTHALAWACDVVLASCFPN